MLKGEAWERGKPWGESANGVGFLENKGKCACNMSTVVGVTSTVQ